MIFTEERVFAGFLLFDGEFWGTDGVDAADFAGNSRAIAGKLGGVAGNFGRITGNRDAIANNLGRIAGNLDVIADNFYGIAGKFTRVAGISG